MGNHIAGLFNILQNKYHFLPEWFEDAMGWAGLGMLAVIIIALIASGIKNNNPEEAKKEKKMLDDELNSIKR